SESGRVVFKKLRSLFFFMVTVADEKKKASRVIWQITPIVRPKLIETVGGGIQDIAEQPKRVVELSV
ncbi:MAG: hypothetical protein ACRD4B_06080, partial [Acidobacteriota bacterium]